MEYRFDNHLAVRVDAFHLGVPPYYLSNDICIILNSHKTA